MKVCRQFNVNDGILGYELFFDDCKNFIKARWYSGNWMMNVSGQEGSVLMDWIEEYQKTGRCSFEPLIAGEN